jgi:hypothetical protein
MTATLDLHPDADHPAIARVREIHELLDAVDVSQPLAAGEYAGAIVEWERAARRIEAVKLRLVAAAGRAGSASLTGMSGTSAWLAKHTTADQPAAARTTKLAAELFDESAQPAATAAALSRGDISTEHARVIADAKAKLPTSLSIVEVTAIEDSLVEKARSLDPASLRKAARRALAVVEADSAEVDAHQDHVLRDEEAAARAKTRFTLHDNQDGTISGHFTVPVLAGRVLERVLDAMTAPRRGPLGASEAHAGAQGLRKDWAHEKGLALVELLEHLPTDHLHNKVAATVVVTLDLDALLGGLRAAGVDTGDEITAGDARRMACGAALVPAVLDGPSVPLDLGRTRRLFAEPQRVALATRYSACLAEGCQRPFAWCELHHRDPWHRGGRSDLGMAEPYCAFHHHRIHDPGYRHQRLPDGSVRFTRRT